MEVFVVPILVNLMEIIFHIMTVIVLLLIQMRTTYYNLHHHSTDWSFYKDNLAPMQLLITLNNRSHRQTYLLVCNSDSSSTGSKQRGWFILLLTLILQMNITHHKVPPSSAFVCKGKPPNLVDS